MKVIKQVITGLVLMTTLVSVGQATTITIGKGSGVMWEGLPFSYTGSRALGDPNYAGNSLIPANGLLAISNSEHVCMGSSRLINIAGYQAFPLGTNTGIGLIPRATGSATYTRYNGASETLKGTIGLPDTAGSTTAGEKVQSPSGYGWCLPPSMTEDSNFYSASRARRVTVSGSWL